VQVYQQGSYLFSAAGAERVARTGDIVVFDLTRPSLIQTEAAFSMSVIVPRRLLAPLVTTLDGIHGRVIHAGTPLNALLVSHMHELTVQAPRLDLAAGVAMSRATAGLVAACSGIATDGQDQAGASVRGAVLHLIRQAIDEHLADPALGPSLLARRFNLSRARLYRLFEPLGGVMNYIQQKRLMRAHQAICDPALFPISIMTLAQRFGFTEKTAFSRAYRALYGMSPSEARALARGGHREAGSQPPVAMDSFLEVNRWINGLDTLQFN
jgi:AraC-like DNA-binding protein